MQQMSKSLQARQTKSLTLNLLAQSPQCQQFCDCIQLDSHKDSTSAS
jgi:hypothetical protein